ncbi:hypothetical protein [Amycolatopsis jejuensis]|uniref:hypothetical protein n=1 Tax=Amycolatopsis jejuensis TaxID=330084 RepID=UPI001B808ADA|nr:hypothetical protein [Amycolatopsis jejuensis]
MAAVIEDEDSCVHCYTEVTRAITRVNCDEEFVCDHCVSLHYVRCDQCDNIYRYLSVADDSGYRLCEECAAASGYRECLDCATLVCERTRCHDCHSAIIEHWEEHLHWSGYQPEPNFLGTGPLFLGLELEINTPERDAQLCQLCNDQLAGVAYLKEDSSIQVGFELVTHPMSFAWAQQNFPWTLLDELAQRGCDGTDVGLHVHVSRDAFSGPPHVFRWMKFIYRNAREVQLLARRYNSHWAAFSPAERADVKDVCKGDRDRPRHLAINVQNSTTFELRMFASSMKPQEVQAALGFADASVRYTEQLTVGAILQNDGWSWNAFHDWANARPEYSALSRESEVLACAC